MGKYLDRSKLYKYMRPEDVVKRLISGLRRRPEVIDVRESLGRFLAEDVRAPVARPWAHISHVDGFAVRAADTSGASSTSPAVLRLVEGVDSRGAHLYEIRPGEAVYVETGYPLPAGADAVIPVEATRVEGGKVYVFRPAKPGQDVFPKGADVEEGALIARAGTRVTPMLRKLLIDLGIPEVKVFARSRAALFPVGDEIVDEVVPPTTGKIPNSSGYAVADAIRYYGGDIVHTKILPDDPATIRDEVAAVIGDVDLVVTIGGVSLGPRDRTWSAIMEGVEARWSFRGIMVQPGRVTSGIALDGAAVINLPGLPQSTFSGSLFVLIPVLKHLQGQEPVARYPSTALTHRGEYVVKEYSSFRRLRFVSIDKEAGEARIYPRKGSYYVSPMALSDGVTVIPPGKVVVGDGEEIRVWFPPPFYYWGVDESM